MLLGFVGRIEIFIDSGEASADAGGQRFIVVLALDKAFDEILEGIKAFAGFWQHGWQVGSDEAPQAVIGLVSDPHVVEAEIGFVADFFGEIVISRWEELIVGLVHNYAATVEQLKANEGNAARD